MPNQTQKKRESKEEHEQRLRQTLAIVKKNAPRRFLALKDWSELSIRIEEFDRLRDETLNFQLPKSASYDDELITRACYLLFALIESGGLCADGKGPQKLLPQIKLEPASALANYLNLPVGERNSNKDSSVQEEQSKDEEGEPVAVRQPLHLLGANHLLAYCYFRKKIAGAKNGDLLLPKLPAKLLAKLETLKQLTSLPWLSDFKGAPKWSHIFDHWLKKKIAEWRDIPASDIKISWNHIREIALWKLLEKERFPLASAYRQRKVTTTNLPEKKMRQIIHDKNWKFSGEKRLVRSSGTISGGNQSITGMEDLPESFTVVRDFLNFLKDNNFDCPQNLPQQIIKFQDLLRLHKASKDVERLFEWFTVMLNNKLSPQSVYTYGQMNIRFLEEIYPLGFSQIQTSDVASYIDNTCGSPNTIRNVRLGLKKFADFLKANKPSAPPNVNWKSRDLKAFQSARERDIITEEEYQQVRASLISNQNLNSAGSENLVLMTLLRRCGLRIGEVSWLTTDDFSGISQLQLQVPRSKTRSGVKRMLPLYLLLDQEELTELKDSIDTVKSRSAQSKYLFVDASNSLAPMPASALGIRAEKILKKSGLAGETAHGLRHALASDLFAALFLDKTKSIQQTKYSKVLKRFYTFCRSKTIY